MLCPCWPPLTFAMVRALGESVTPAMSAGCRQEPRTGQATATPTMVQPTAPTLFCLLRTGMLRDHHGDFTMRLAGWMLAWQLLHGGFPHAA